MLRGLRRTSMGLGAVVLLAGLGGLGYASRRFWLPASWSTEAVQPAVPEASTSAGDKILLTDQAQKNLNLTAKSLKATTFWKTITVPGTVIDRPGVSDREVVAPAIGIISEIRHVPGDTVRPGDVLFTLRLTSETLQEAQTALFKCSQELKLAEGKLKRLLAAGEGIPQSRVIEAESDVKRLQVTAKSYRESLLRRGFSEGEIGRVAEGELVSELPIIVNRSAPDHSSLEFEVQELQVEAGQQVQAGQTLCLLSNHQSLAIEGRAFRDEIPLLEHSIQEARPVEVDFQEASLSDWPPLEQTFVIRHIANTIDPATRTYSFLLPLENQSKSIESQHRMQRLWRFRPGQKVWLRVRTEELENVFVLPVEAVVREGAEAYLFTQNVNTFQRVSVHLLFHDRQWAVIANDGSLPTYRKKDDVLTIPAVVQTAAAQLNRMTKAGSSGVPKGYHIHADGSLHENEDEGK